MTKWVAGSAREDYESGAATPLAILVSTALLIVFVALAGTAAATIAPLRRLEAESVEFEELESVVARVVELLGSDDTPDADSSGDPVFNELSGGSDIAVTIRDVSSLVNPNWVQTFFIERSTLEPLILRSGVSAGDLQTARINDGFTMRPQIDFTAFLTDTAIAELISPYSFLNVNTSGEIELESVFAELTGNAAAATAFRSRIQRVRSELGTVGQDDLFSLLTPYFDDVYPVINAFPPYNVHLVDERILQAVVSYPAFEIRNWRAAYNSLLSLRASREMTADEIRATLGVAPDNRVLQYLGTTTWFWEVSILAGAQFRVHIVRVPGANRREDDFRVVGIEEVELE